ncbi:MAG: 6,7-dimethyl-8-ribityllumazine synthase [Myxococcota bacterium]|jgi:6,7-dimethyl-8-ribityllumazine synthase|nr:6,7-dimethyl-8-ribityllumazine synthase [Myxococcota bacterium]
MSDWKAESANLVQAKPTWRIGVVVARFNEDITAELLKGFEEMCLEAGMDKGQIEVHWVPGAIELPIALKMLGKTGRVQALCGLGAVIRGGTPHFDYVCQQVSYGVQKVALDLELPVVFGVLTTDDLAQARERALTTKDNKGGEAAQAALEMLMRFEEIKG